MTTASEDALRAGQRGRAGTLAVARAQDAVLGRLRAYLGMDGATGDASREALERAYADLDALLAPEHEADAARRAKVEAAALAAEEVLRG